MKNDKNYLLELNSIGSRLKNLIHRIRYKKWFETIINYEKLDIKFKHNSEISDYSKIFFELTDNLKKQILSNWECGHQPVIQTNWIMEKLDLKKIESVIKENKNSIEEHFNIHLLRTDIISDSVICCFLGIKPMSFQFINGMLQETQPTYYINIIYSQNLNILQFRTSENIENFKKYFISCLNQIYRNCKLELNKKQILSLANEAFARNAKIQCEGEEIHERAYAVPENKNLFSISEFIELVKKKNYIIRKIFVSLNLKSLKTPYNQVSLRIFPRQGKFSFTGFVNEEQIRETFKILQKIRSTTPIPKKFKLMDKFL